MKPEFDSEIGTVLVRVGQLRTHGNCSDITAFSASAEYVISLGIGCTIITVLLSEDCVRVKCHIKITVYRQYYTFPWAQITYHFEVYHIYICILITSYVVIDQKS